MSRIPPHFAGLPVMLVHFSSTRDSEGRPLAACSGVPFEQVNARGLYPLVPCMGCLIAARLAHFRATDAELGAAVEAAGRTLCRRCGWPVDDGDGAPGGLLHPWCPEVR